MHWIEEALRENGYTRAEIDFLNILLINPSAYQDMLRRLGLKENQSQYNHTYEQAGDQEGIINIIEGEQQGKLNDGDLMIIVAAGVGYVWGAACETWEPR
jgi:3-oxoacyl-[acyl-carrier-protein] synthase-3